MFDAIHDFETFGPAHSGILDPLRAFLQDHCEALLDAAALLAGRRGVRVARSVLDGLERTGTPPRRVGHELQDLLDILTLAHVHDLSREEASRFAAIDPADPCVEEICLLADGLRGAIDATRAGPEQAGVPRKVGRAAA